MIHAAAIAESIIAPTLFRPAFLHSLGHKRTLSLAPSMSAVGGIADIGCPLFESEAFLRRRCPLTRVKRTLFLTIGMSACSQKATCTVTETRKRGEELVKAAKSLDD